MDVIKVAKTPGTVGPVIKHLSGWEDYVPSGWPKPAPKPEDGPPDAKIEGDYGFSGGDSEGYITDEDPTWDIDGGDRKGIITDGDKDTWGISGGWDAHSGDWGFKGDDDGAEELFARDEKWWKGGTGCSGIGGGSSNIKHLGDDQYDAATEYGGIILKVDGSSWFGGTNEGIIKTGSRIPVLWKSTEWLGPMFWKADPTWVSGEGLLIDPDDTGPFGHTCPFIKAEKQIDQPRT